MFVKKEIKIAFLDRDGTINFDKGYVYKIEDFEFIPGVVEALKLLQDNGYLIVIVTNQSGVARGFYTEEDIEFLHSWLKKVLERNQVYLFDILYCPHLKDAPLRQYSCDCSCRKPKLGLYEKAIRKIREKYDINFGDSIVVGDRMSDLEAAVKYKMRGYLVAGSEKCYIIQSRKKNPYKTIKYKETILDAVRDCLKM